MSKSHPIVPERFETLLLARLSSTGDPPTETKLAHVLRRYAPASLDDAAWRSLVAETLQALQRGQFVTATRQMARADELKRRLGPHAAKRWQLRFERILPGLGLGIRADDARSHDRLGDREAWSAAITGRTLELWTEGLPPSLVAVCDALVWRELGLAGAPKRCPPELRAHFLRSHVAVDRGSPAQLVRLYAAQAVEAPRADSPSILAGLIRLWLTGRELVARGEPALSVAVSVPPAVPARSPSPVETSLVDTVRTVAHRARDGVFGDRKVFISSVWNALRAIPPWSALALDDFKAALIAAHRRQELVLARADLVAAMDPTLVASSETRTDGATFHFIVREPIR